MMGGDDIFVAVILSVYTNTWKEGRRRKKRKGGPGSERHAFVMRPLSDVYITSHAQVNAL